MHNGLYQVRVPDATESELLLQLARLRLGDDLVDRVYRNR